LPLMPILVDDDGVNGTECRLTSALYVHNIGDLVLKALRDPNAKRLFEIEMQRRGARIAATAAPVNWPPSNEKTGDDRVVVLILIRTDAKRDDNNGDG
jgi:hypothetical protein